VLGGLVPIGASTRSAPAEETAMEHGQYPRLRSFYTSANPPKASWLRR